MSAAMRKASLGRKLDLNYIYLDILIHSPGYVRVTPRGQKFVDRLSKPANFPQKS